MDVATAFVIENRHPKQIWYMRHAHAALRPKDRLAVHACGYVPHALLKKRVGSKYDGLNMEVKGDSASDF